MKWKELYEPIYEVWPEDEQSVSPPPRQEPPTSVAWDDLYPRNDDEESLFEHMVDEYIEDLDAGGTGRGVAAAYATRLRRIREGLE